MPHNYHQLSPADFERLCADLLGAQWGVRFELFGEGPDGGVDMRANVSGVTVIGQAKRYAHFSDLRRAAQSEVAKVQRLAPGRYVLLTSCSLTPANKDWLVDLFAPWCRQDVAIWGRDDLDAALSRHPAVLRRHIRLWLQEEAQLQAVLHNGWYQLSAAMRASLQNQLAHFVVHPQVLESLDRLRQRHLLLVTGDAGVGKSTLCGYLALQLAAESGYDIQIFQDTIGLKGAWELLQPERKQCFVVDDFLGATFLDTEQALALERSLLLLMDRATKHNGQFKLLIASRNYVLQQASERLPGLQQWLQAKGDEHAVQLAYDALSDRAKADILFNLVYDSPLTASQKNALAQKRLYWPIIRHRHFNPRLLINILNAAGTDENGQDMGWLVKQLDDPLAYWEQTFVRLSEAAQCVLYTIALGQGALVEDELSRCFAAFYQAMYAKVPPVTGLQTALSELEPGLVKSFEDKAGIWVTFASPGVADMTHRMMQQHAGLLDAAIQSMACFDQAECLMRLHRAPDGPIQCRDDQLANLLSRMESLIGHAQQRRFGGLNYAWAHRIREGAQAGACWRYIRQTSDKLRETSSIKNATQQLTQRVANADWQAWFMRGEYDQLLRLAFDCLPQSRWPEIVRQAIESMQNTEDAVGLVDPYKHNSAVRALLETESEILQDKVAEVCADEMAMAHTEDQVSAILSDIETLEADLCLDLETEKYQAWEAMEAMRVDEADAPNPEPVPDYAGKEYVENERQYIDALFAIYA